MHGIEVVAVFIEHGIGAGVQRWRVERAQLRQHLGQAAGQCRLAGRRARQFIEQAGKDVAPDGRTGAIHGQHRHAVLHRAAQRVGVGGGHGAGRQFSHHGGLRIGQRGHQHQVTLHARVDGDALDIALRQFAQAQGARLEQAVRLRQQQARNRVVVQAFDFAWLKNALYQWSFPIKKSKAEPAELAVL